MPGLLFVMAMQSGLCASEPLPMAAKAPAGWLTSLPQAQEKAKRENKLLLYFFTGSDWCGFCHQLEKEVLFTPEFKDWAAANAVLLYLDFPKMSRLPDALKQQNITLAKKYGITGFPSILFFSPEGEPLTMLGYIEGGARNWLEKARMLLPKRLELEKSLTSAYFKAERLKLPLLVIATIGKYDTQVNRMVEDVLADKNVMLNSGENLLISRLDLTGASADDLGLWRNLSAKNKVGKNYPVFLMVDSSYNRIFAISGKNSSAAAIAGRVYSNLPKPEYDGRWLVDYPRAQRIARALNRPMILNFTGSDWCKYCHILADEVYKTQEFKDFARKNLVLVELDYPKRKQLPYSLAQQNKVISDAFGINSFPLEVIMLNTNIPVASFGYTGAKPAEIIDLIKKATCQ